MRRSPASAGAPGWRFRVLQHLLETSAIKPCSQPGRAETLHELVNPLLPFSIVVDRPPPFRDSRDRAGAQISASAPQAGVDGAINDTAAGRKDLRASSSMKTLSRPMVTVRFRLAQHRAQRIGLRRGRAPGSRCRRSAPVIDAKAGALGQAGAGFRPSPRGKSARASVAAAEGFAVLG